MTEEGVGKHVVIQTGHVDRHELALAAAQVMDGPGNQFFADSGFTVDQHRLTRSGDYLHVLENSPHFLVAGDDRLKSAGMFEAVIQQPVLEG